MNSAVAQCGVAAQTALGHVLAARVQASPPVSWAKPKSNNCKAQTTARPSSAAQLRPVPDEFTRLQSSRTVAGTWWIKKR